MTDYIKREDALEIVNNNLSRFMIALRIGDCPSADVAPVRHGRWKPFDRTWGRSVFTCTACGDAMDVPTEMGNPLFVYCPNCGARMDGEDDETDRR